MSEPVFRVVTLVEGSDDNGAVLRTWEVPDGWQPPAEWGEPIETGFVAHVPDTAEEVQAINDVMGLMVSP